MTPVATFEYPSDPIAPGKKASRPLACPKGAATEAKQPGQYWECGEATYHPIHG